MILEIKFAPIAQSVEQIPLKDKVSRFKSWWGHHGGYGVIVALGSVEPSVRMQIPLATPQKKQLFLVVFNF